MYINISFMIGQNSLVSIYKKSYISTQKNLLVGIGAKARRMKGKGKNACTKKTKKAVKVTPKKEENEEKALFTTEDITGKMSRVFLAQ